MATLTIKGTSYPSTPAQDDIFFLEDAYDAHKPMWTYYDGTRWLSAHHFHTGGYINANTVAGYAEKIRIPRGGLSVYLPAINVCASTFTAATNDGSNYWTVTIRIYDATFANNTLIHQFTTAADTAATWTDHSDVPDNNAVSYHDMVNISFAKTGSPGGITCSWGLAYQLIAT